MKKILLVFILILSSFPSFSLESRASELNVLTSYNYIANLVLIIGKDKVNVDYMAKPTSDPHHIVAKPSLIAKARRADLLIINGAQLEIGWIPPIIKDSNNPNIQPGRTGFLDLSARIKKIQIPDSVSREQGDIHPDGNPHFYVDPYNMKIIAKSIADQLSLLDSENKGFYQSNLSRFLQSWEQKISQWENDLKKIKGLKVIQYHKNFDYLYKRYGIESVIELEPMPGIPPTGKHIQKVIDTVSRENVKWIVLGVYHPYKVGEKIAEKTSAKIILLPTDVNSLPEASDVFTMIDLIVKRLTQ